MAFSLFVSDSTADKSRMGLIVGCVSTPLFTRSTILAIESDMPFKASLPTSFTAEVTILEFSIKPSARPRTPNLPIFINSLDGELISHTA